MADVALGAVAEVSGETAGSDDTASRLVRAAIEVFAEKGYDGAGVAEIARRAGMTTGAIYSRFSGKAELLAEAIAASSSDELERMFTRDEYRGRVTDLLAVVGSHLVNEELDTNRALLLEAFAAARRDPALAEILRGRLTVSAVELGELVEESRANGLVDADVDTASVVQFAQAVGLGFVLLEAVGADRPDPEAWGRLITRLVAAVVPAGAAGPSESRQSGPTESAHPNTGPTDRRHPKENIHD
jgi:TetR/AcrR family transcriptional regulator, repressor for uid operon